MIFYGIDGAVAWPWGTGSTSFMCIKSPLQRTPLQLTSGTAPCTGILALN